MAKMINVKAIKAVANEGINYSAGDVFEIADDKNTKGLIKLGIVEKVNTESVIENVTEDTESVVEEPVE